MEEKHYIDSPLVSILIPCYNHEKYLDDCFKSLLAQTYINIEIFITDDCSKDDSVEIIEEWMDRLRERFVKVVFIKNDTNLGVVKSVNNMINLSRGKYIKTLASDDMLFPEGIRALVSFLEKEVEFGLVYSNYVLCNENEKYEVENLEKKSTQRSSTLSGSLSQALYEQDFIIAPTVLVRKKVYSEVGLHDETLLMEDWEFWIRASFSFKIGYLDYTTAAYRIVSNSMSRFSNDASGMKRLRLMIENEFKILDKFKDNPIIKSKIGIRRCCDQGISLAIDFEEDELVSYIKGYLKKNQGRLGFKMELKYILYKLRIWRLIKLLR